MKVYFVRHGESEGNVAGSIQQSDITPLTKEGRNQAKIAGERFSTIKIDLVLASPIIRAKQTAEIINETINKPIEFTDLLVERKWPSEQIGINREDPVSVKILKITKENFHVSGFRYSDEENFEDLKKRALLFLDKITSLPHENILVVTHGLFMRMLVSCMVMGKELTSHEYFKIMVSFEMKNTGITLCEYDPTSDKRSNPWHIVAWNDHAHLG